MITKYFIALHNLSSARNTRRNTRWKLLHVKIHSFVFSLLHFLNTINQKETCSSCDGRTEAFRGFLISLFFTAQLVLEMFLYFKFAIKKMSSMTQLNQRNMLFLMFVKNAGFTSNRRLGGYHLNLIILLNSTFIG